MDNMDDSILGVQPWIIRSTDMDNMDDTILRSTDMDKHG